MHHLIYTDRDGQRIAVNLDDGHGAAAYVTRRDTGARLVRIVWPTEYGRRMTAAPIETLEVVA